MTRTLLALFLCLPLLFATGGCGSPGRTPKKKAVSRQTRTGSYIPVAVIDRDGGGDRQQEVKRKKRNKETPKAPREDDPNFVPRGGFR